MPPTGTTAAQRQFLITIAGVAGTFATKRGGARTSETSSDYDGGSLDPDVLASPPVYEDLTIGRSYKPERDAALLRQLRPQVARLRTSITVQPLDRDLVATEQPTVYVALLKGVNDPDADANSGDPARLELTWAVESAS